MKPILGALALCGLMMFAAGTASADASELDNCLSSTDDGKDKRALIINNSCNYPITVYWCYTKKGKEKWNQGRMCGSNKKRYYRKVWPLPAGESRSISAARGRSPVFAVCKGDHGLGGSREFRSDPDGSYYCPSKSDASQRDDRTEHTRESTLSDGKPLDMCKYNLPSNAVTVKEVYAWWGDNFHDFVSDWVWVLSALGEGGIGSHGYKIPASTPSSLEIALHAAIRNANSGNVKEPSRWVRTLNTLRAISECESDLMVANPKVTEPTLESVEALYRAKVGENIRRDRLRMWGDACDRAKEKARDLGVIRKSSDLIELNWDKSGGSFDHECYCKRLLSLIQCSVEYYPHASGQ